MDNTINSSYCFDYFGCNYFSLYFSFH